MSNEEKKKREDYKKNRKKWIFIQSIILVIVTLFTVISGYIYFERSQTFYISYNETSQIDYRVKYDQNSFYEDEWQSKGQDYVGGLIDEIEIEFDYKFETEASDVKYEYSYDITAKMDVREKGGTKELLPTERSLLDNGPVVNQVQDSNTPLIINQKVLFSYDVFNDYVRGYVNNFKLDNLMTNLIVKMSIDIKSTCDDFESDEHSTYEMTVIIPLIEQVVSVSETSSVPPSDGKLLACESSLEKDTYKVLTIVGGSLDVLLGIGLLLFVLFTRNTDVNYENKVRKIVNNYKSFIQKIKNDFNMEGNQILEVSTFEELLEIRDTIQEPILMNENEDKTCTSFIVPTDKQIVYIYQVKVDDYDQIYGVNKEEVKEEVEKVEDNVIEEEKNPFFDRINYSYEARLVLSDFQTKHFYKEIVTFVNKYGVKISRSWSKERIYIGRKLFAILTFRGKKLSIAFPFNLDDYEGTKYRFIDMGALKKYQNTPALIKLTSERKVKYSLELLEKSFKEAGIENKNLPFTFKRINYKSKNQLIKLGLIKEPKKEKMTV